MTTVAPWASEALDSLLTPNARRMGGSHWVSTENGNPIEFTGGIPDPGSLPVDALMEAVRVVLKREAAAALEYGGSQGFLGLRELIAGRIAAEDGLAMSAENIILTSGGYPALQLICETFVEPGDVVLADAPAWGGFIRLARAIGAKVVGVPLDKEGPIIDAADQILERLRADGERVKLLYTIPTFQNPMGIAFTPERRRSLVELAARHRVLIVEDDPYRDLRFGGGPLPSLFALSGGEGVLKVGSFSKNIATGLRVGWLQASKDYVEALLRLRFDNGTSPFLSRTIAAYIEGGTFEPHVEKLRGIYRAKCDAMLSALAESCAHHATWTQPEGGFFAWLTLADGIDQQKVMRYAAEEGVAIVPGTSFFGDGGGGRNIRLAYSYVDEDQIVEGVRRLARALDRARG